jgi:glycosyltransferase involved in cell wall biosynthesis
MHARPALRRYDLAWTAVRRACELGAEVVYTWMLQAAVLALWRGVPTVLELHDRVTGRIGPWLFRRFLAARGEKRLLLITQALRQRLEHDFGVQLSQDVAILAPNGSEPERYASLPSANEARQQLGLPERTTAVYTGGFYAGRGMELLAGLAQAFPQVGFVWIGGRPTEVEKWGAKLAGEGINNVILTGFVENRKLPLYQAAGDILLMPYGRVIAGSSGGNSADICSPMKMFDYLASGRAILASDLPVLHEVLHESNAVFCPPEDEQAWREALAALLADSARREALGRQAKADAGRYSWVERERRALENFPRQQ